MEEQPTKILVIDDDDVDRIALLRAFGKIDMRIDVTEARSAEEAREVLGQDNFDCIFLDHNLPDTKGLDLLKAIRSNENRPTPIIVFTAAGSEELAVQMMKAGATDYMSKDLITADYLGMAIRNAVRISQVESKNIATRRALEASEKLHRAILDNMTDIVLTADPTGVIQTVNSRMETEYQVAITDIVGTPVHTICNYRRLKDVSAAVEKLKEEENIKDECELTLPNGLTLPVEASLFLVQIENEDHLGIRFHDLSDRTAAEKMKNEFLSIVSHELRTPATSIQGSIKLLMAGAAGDISDKARQLLDICYRNTRRLIWLLNDILDIQKIEAGSLSINYREFDMASTVAETVESMEGFATQHQVTIETLLPPEPLRLNADPERIQQVLANLISNAVKFSPQNAKVVVQLKNGQDMLRVEVRDNGPGISDEFKETVFRKFQQLEQSAGVDRKPGTGLGLAISKALVNAHSGDISFEPNTPQGTIFYFTLPL